MNSEQVIGRGAEALSEEDRARAEVYSLLGALLIKPPDRELLGLLRGIEVPSGDPGMPEAPVFTCRQAAPEQRQA